MHWVAVIYLKPLILATTNDYQEKRKARLQY